MSKRLELSDIGPYVQACIHDEAAPCSCACPFGMDVRSLMKKLAKGRMSSAYKEFRTATVFPTIAAALCDHPCEGKCQRTRIGDESIAIGDLEKAILSLAKAQPADVFQIPEKEAKIAVIGAGVSGLSLALNMAQKKYPVTVFEQEEQWGGSLREHPDFPVFEEDIKLQTAQEKIEYRFGTKITSLEEVREFDAVYIATGKGGETFGLSESWNSAWYTTGEPKVFMGGECCGQSVAEGVAAGKHAARTMECVIQTGRVIPDNKRICDDAVSLVPKGAVSEKRISAADPVGGYTKDEVKQEAGRCFLCNCDRCMKGCELMNKYGKPPLQAGNEVVADLGAHFLASRTMTRQSYSCNQCGWCESICPEKISMGEIFHTSRRERVVKGIQPEAFHDYWLRELDFVSGEGFYASVSEGKAYEYAFFPGCQAGASLPDQVIAAGQWLKEQYDAGVVLGCCGASAWWAGAQDCWEANSAALKKVWENMGKPVFVLACATCFDMLQKMVPEIPTVSIYEMMEEKQIPVTGLDSHAAVFDPCAASRNEPMQKAVRALSARAGCEREELPESGRCCGWGGHMRSVNPDLYNTITDHRCEMSELPYIVYCANCRDVFLEKGKPCRHILEYAFGPEEKQYYLQQKKENRLRVKESFEMFYEGKKEVRMAKEWDSVKIHAGEEVRKEMERLLISDEDVRECIWQSRQTDGSRFAGEDGTYLASMAKRVVTYWVEYRETGEEFEVVSAYCHRMKILAP